MAYQSIFRRYELKYLLTSSEHDILLRDIAPYITPDRYGKSTIRNIYFDTDSYRLIRRSMEKPLYKEKLRLRSYAPSDDDTPVFVELKKKYDGVVYKRRLSVPQREATAWLCERRDIGQNGQIAQEIEYFLNYYGNLHPSVFLSYDREAYYATDGSELRITFDTNLLARTDRLSLCYEVDGTPLLSEGHVLMEIKCAGGFPLWLTSALSALRLYKTSFSKYGTAYQKLLFSQEKEKPTYV